MGVFMSMDEWIVRYQRTLWSAQNYCVAVCCFIAIPPIHGNMTVSSSSAARPRKIWLTLGRTTRFLRRF